MGKEVTTNEILDAINDFAGKTEQRFEKIESEIGGMKSEIGSIRATMVTKDYLDEKMADLRGDLVVLTRKEDVKVKRLVELLCEKKVLTENEKKELFSMEPFPQLML